MSAFINQGKLNRGISRPFLFPSVPLRKIISCIAIIALFLTVSTVVFASQITLAWDRNSEPDVAGYNIYYGTESGNYQYKVDVGNNTSCTISSLEEDTTYFFAATAYSSPLNESDFSEEIQHTTPITVQPHEPTIYVADISVKLSKKGSKYQARASAIIWDDLGRTISEAVVDGQWFLNGKYINEVSNLSDIQGAANLILNRFKAKTGDQLTFLIINVVKNGYSYDSASNVSDETSVQLP